MLNIKKRDGNIVPFNLNKIKVAIEKAFDAVGKNYSDDIIDMLALRVTATFNDKVKDDCVSVEDIQDAVEVVLIQSGYVEVAKAYILYRKQHEKLREMNSTMLDYKNTVNNYLKINDWRVKENSTVTYSVGGLILSNSGAVTANYWLSEIYDDEIAKAHREAQIHIHDLSMLTGYCAGWSLKQLIKEGLGGIPGKITSSPAGHLSTLCNQMVNFLGIMQTNGQAHKRSALSTPILRRLSRWTTFPTKKSNNAFNPSSTASTPLRVGVRKRLSPTSRLTGLCQTTLQNCPQSSAARKWTSSIRTARRKWQWSTRRLSRS